jgi:hypothetical protein
MKTFFQAIIGSIILHVLFFVSMFVVGYIKTITYKPDFSSEWDQVILQDSVAFGIIVSPIYSLSTFVGVAVVFGLIIVTINKLFGHKQKETLT